MAYATGILSRYDVYSPLAHITRANSALLPPSLPPPPPPARTYPLLFAIIPRCSLLLASLPTPSTLLPTPAV